MHVHLRGHFCLSRHAVNYWREKQKAGSNPDARIINTSSGAGLQGSIAQAAYSTAKGGIASLTLVQAAELGRYGITANALAPSARTRMTEQAFAEKMATEGHSFDVMDPANIAPTVVWLGSAQSADVTGCVFELEGGKIMLEDGWREGPMVDAGARWNPWDVGEAVEKLLTARTPPRKVWEQAMIGETARAFFAESATSEHTRKAMAGDGIDRALWQSFCGELGLGGVALPEAYGGAGLGMVEFALV
eukprot:gene27488-49102_t